MKYTVETTDTGCIETLEFKDDLLGDVKFTRKHERLDDGSVCKDAKFSEQMERIGYSEEIVERAETCFDVFAGAHFIELDTEMRC